jgi:hypothetical protein
MASLDNFHTGNPAPQPHVGEGSMYPYHTAQRHALIQRDLIGGTGKRNGWDVASRVPVAPVQPVVDPLLQTGRSAPDPSYVERLSTGLSDHFVQTRPRTHLGEAGDTAEFKMLIRGTTCWRDRVRNFLGGGGGRMSVVPLNTYTRYHPYLGR